MKKHREKQIILWVGSFLLLLIISACSTSNANSNKSNEQEEESEKTVQYTTITGEQVEIPADPKRVVYIGQTVGDFLAMDIPIVGNNLPKDSPSYYEGKLEGIVDIGNPADLETILTLKPDRLLMAITRLIQILMKNCQKSLLRFPLILLFLIQNE